MSQTRWLSDDEQRTWRAFLAAQRLLSDRLERQLQTESGIPHAYYEILVNLSEVPGRTMRMSKLAATSLSSRSRLSHAVARMEEAGWVRRTECTTDRRGAMCELTDAGFAAIQAAAPGHVATVREFLFDQLSEEQVKQLHEISTAVANNLGGNGNWPLKEELPRDLPARGAPRRK
ncbi:MarR family winged helix-turn-helix transcriptional regulator [Pseudonocardia spinosispora]|uniref:MarR family winged helix-turn-helix transcriptional regulator n=1 Tax=Pseudonocardia spinosispora TaxID=103441 RepID=UPI00041D1367|nr:MarR family winged helix-turn-helix transcriptional regulator [Pseudonocardia spinosispora]